jgi:iron complex outermembrane receptor protein
MNQTRVIAWALGLLPGAALGAQADLLALPLEELVSLEVSVATGTPKPLAATPAAASVLLGGDFRAIGARTPDEALVAVPGLHVAPFSGLMGSTRYFMRGIASGPSAQTLLLVNGIPMTTMLQGNSVPTLEGGVPIQMVERIEVIRGPGSAVHGADAFAGVINIITRDAEQLADGRAGASYGSFNTGTAYAAQGGEMGGAKAAVMLSYAGSKGDNGVIAADAQTANDSLLPLPPASLAPGEVNQERQRFDLYATLKWTQVDVHAFWREVRNFGTNQGVGSALDPVGELAQRRVGTDLTWHREDLGEWDVELQLAWLHTGIRTSVPLRTLPPGAFGFPEGLIDEFELLEDRSRLQFTALYHGFAGHRLRLGAGASQNDMYENTSRRNYLYTVPGLPPSPRPGGLTDVSDTSDTFLPESARVGAFVFVQDEWRFRPGWELTAGLRYDDYSDFGDVVAPRLALVWETSSSLTTKLIYGEAFRAPSFTELYATSNPFALGNPTLQPEELRSVELEFGIHPGGAWVWNVNLWRFRIEDYIDFVPMPGTLTLMAQNVGRYRGEGLTNELVWKHDGTELNANLTVQRTENVQTGEDQGVAPDYFGYLRASRELAPRWLLAAQVRYVGPRERQPGDPQPDLAGYTSLDLVLRHQLRENLELHAIGRNVLDEDMREPGTSPLPESIPLPGASLSLGADYRW